MQRIVRILGRIESHEFSFHEACQNDSSTDREFEWCTTNACTEPLDGLLSSALPQIRNATVPTLDTMFLAASASPRQNPLHVYRTFSGRHQQPPFRRRQHMCTACLFLERSGEW